ncbi:MAG: DUF2281 domain-containing protein [Thermoguttaceae bacterium]
MTVIENVVEKLTQLPPSCQLEVLDFVVFLAEKKARKQSLDNPEGLWAGNEADISAEELAEARKEMWGKYDRGE